MPRSITELEQYLDREFGPIDNLVDQTERRSRVMLDEAPDADVSDLKDVVGDSSAGKSGPALPELERQPYQVQQEGNWDRTRLLGAGVVDLAEMAVGIPEYLARQTGLDSVASGAEKVRGGLGEIREGILSGVSPEYLDRVGKEIMTLDPSRSLWRSGNPLQVADAIYGKFVRSLPSTLAVMYPAARLFAAGATRGALTYLGASEGGLSVGAIANNLTDEIKGMTNEQLLKESPRYAQIYQEVGSDEAEARTRFTAEAQRFAPLVGGAAVAAISLATGRLLKPVFDPTEAAAKGLTLGKRFGVGFGEEFLQEGSQGVSEQMAQNFAAKIYDENRPLMEGALEAFGQEGLIGGLTGGAVAGALGRRPPKPPGPPIEDEGGQLTLPGFGPQITGPSALDQQRGPVLPDQSVTGIDLETGQTTFNFGQDQQAVGERTDQLDLGPGMDLRSERTYQTRGGETRVLPEDMQVKGRDISDETGFTMPGSTGYIVWVENEETGKQVTPPKRFAGKAAAEKYAKKLKPKKGNRVRFENDQRPASTMEVDEQGQGQLPLGDRNPLRDRVPGERTIPPGAPFEATMPDEADQPTAEPLADIEAQLNDFQNTGGRSAVYLSPEQRNAPRQIPKGAKVVPNWDGRGGTMIFKTAATAKRGAELARRVRNGEITWQEAIGELTLSGRGKPAEGRYVVQLLDKSGNVARESMVPNLSSAQNLRNKWKADGEVRVTTPEAAVRRRGALMEESLDTDREPVTKTSAVEYQARAEDDGQMTLPGFETTRKGVKVSEGTVPSQELDQRNLEIEDEIPVRKAEQEAAARQAKQEADQQAREEYERKRRFEEESQKEFDETISDRELDAMVTRRIDAYELVETEDGRLDAKPFQKEYADQEKAQEEWEALNERNKAKLREFGLPEDKDDFAKHLKDLKKRVVKDPPEDMTEKQRKAWAEKNRGKITRSEFDEYSEYLRDLRDNKMVGGGVLLEGSEELDILFERAIRASSDRQPVPTLPYFDERPGGKDEGVFDEEAAKQRVADADFTGKVDRLQDPADYATKEEGRIFDAELDAKLEAEEAEQESTEEGDEPATTIEKQQRQIYGDTPGNKLKFIRRERSAQINRKAEIRDVKDTKVVVNEKGKTTGTKPLTYEAVPAEETRQQKRDRIQKTKEANKVLRAALNRAKQFIKRFETGGIFGTYRGKDFAKAKEHYREFIKLAEALLNPQLFQASYTETYEAETKEAAVYYVVYAAVKTESAYKTGEQVKMRPFATTTNQQAADQYAQQLTEDGATNVEIRKEAGMATGKPRTYQRVAIKTFSDRKSAETFLQQQGVSAEQAPSQVSVVRTDTHSAGQVSTATEVAKVLDSATRGMDAQAFEKKFGTLSDKQERLMAKSLPSNRKETRAQKTAKIKKKSSERLNEAKWRQIRTAWDNNEFYRELVAPVINKIANAALETYQSIESGSDRSVIYTPTETEIRQIRSVLKAWRAPGTKLNPEIFADPLRDALRNIGFTFDENGDVAGYEPYIAQETSNGIQMPSGHIFAPYEEGFIGPLPKPKPVKLTNAELQAENREEYRALQEKRKAAALERQQKKEYAATRRARTRRMNRAESERQRTPDSRRAEANEAMELAEKRQVIRTIQAINALVDRFKERVAHSKTRNNEIKKEEQRMIAGLIDLGVWIPSESGTWGTISIGGYVRKTYRLVGPRIGKKEGQITGKKAKELVAKNAHMAVPQQLVKLRNKLTTRQPAGAIIVDESGSAIPLTESTEFSTYGPNIQTLLDETDQIDTFDLFMENLNLAENSPQLDAAASEVGDMIRDRYSKQPINDVLDAIIRNLPENHFYTSLAKKLRSMGMNNIQIHYDWADTKFTGRKKNHLGIYDPRTGRIYLNRRRMGERMGGLSGTEAIHTILHETLHAATAAELKSNWKLRNHFFKVRAAAIAEWKRQYGNKNMPYGLQLKRNEEGQWTPVDEFVAEVFASSDLQDFLKGVPVAMEGSMNPLATAWSYIKDALINLLGWGNIPQITNLFDAFMAPADMVFAKAGQRVSGKDLSLGPDEFLRKTANAVHAKVAQRDQIWNRLKERLKNPNLRFSKFALNMSTMEQFFSMYEDFFNITNDEGYVVNPLKKYQKAFNAKIGHAAERMERPTKLSGEWTSLEESDPDAALEMSEVMTQARLYEIAAEEPISHERNAHLTTPAAKAKHKEVHDRFNALPEPAKKLYRKVRAYYMDTAIERQTYLMQSGLRGIVGITFTEEQLKNAKTKADLDELLKEHINDEERRDMVDTLYEMSRVPIKTQGDYFPLMRYGDNVVYAEGRVSREIFEDRKSARERRAELDTDDPTLDVNYHRLDDGSWAVDTWVREFRMTEHKSDIFRHYDELLEKYPEGGDVEVFGPQPSRKVLEGTTITSNAQLNSVLEALAGEPAAQAAIKQFYLQGLADESMRKHELSAMNRRGVDGSLQHRNLASYARQSSYYVSQLQFGWQMAEAIDEMDKYVSRMKGRELPYDLREVLNQLIKRDQMGHILPDINLLVRSAVEGTHFFMLTSPSYWAINATQPWMVSLPQMAARYGVGNTYAMMNKTMKLISPVLGKQALKTRLGLKALTDRELREESFNIIDQLLEELKLNTSAENFAEFNNLIKNLRQQNIIDINVFTEMRELAQGKVGGVKGAWTGVVDASRVMAHLTEVNNRVLTALTAYQLARNNGETVEAASEYAGKIVSKTQFNYSSQNKPPLFQAGGPLGMAAPLMFQFMQWPQHMYALLIENYTGMVKAGVMNKSEARTALLGLLATHTAVGGMIGMALQPIKWAIGMALMAFGDEDEPYTLANALSGQTFDQLIAEISADLFGTTLGTFVSKGVPAGFGIDLSTRMSMGTLYFIDLRGDDPTSVLGSLVASFGGATLNQGVNFSRGLGYAMDGDYLRGLETAMPKFGRDVLRAIRYSREGLVNSQGDTVIDASQMSLAEVLAQSVGFAPTDVSDFYDAQAAMKGAETFAKKRRERLLKDFRTAKSGTERMKVLREIRGFNRGNRQEAIEADTLWSTWEAKFQREFRYRRLGANIDEEKARFYREYGAPYRD